MKRSKIIALLLLPSFIYAQHFTDGKKVQVYTTAENTANDMFLFGGHMRELNWQASTNYAEEGWANANGVAADLPKRSGIIALLLKQKNIQITSALYDLETGKVDFK